MMFESKSFSQSVSLSHKSVHVEEIHFHLGDILPSDRPNYGESDNTILKVVMHFSDPYGRDRTKTMTLPSTTIL